MRAKSISSLRTRSHINTRLQIREERAHAYRLIPWLALVNISFALVDRLVAPTGTFVEFLTVRVLAVILSRGFYVLTRGRLRYACRLFFTVAPYMYGVEYIMFRYGLLSSPYFAGLALVMVTSTMLFPIPARLASVVYFACVAPIFVWLIFNPLPNLIESFNVALMCAGSVMVCSVNSGQVYLDLRARFVASEALARDLGKREKEIREKAEELLKRQIFESQFSPQVVAAVLKDRALTREMRRQDIVTVVVDIQDSTSKANQIPPKNYKEVVEEVLDVFSAACLKWNITLDKFTGDGVQAFAGAPVAEDNDLERALMACADSMKMLRARKGSLEILWQDDLNVRFAVTQGPALVGFVGRGIFKSYTALGDVVSFTHRLGGVPEPWTIAAHIWGSRHGAEIQCAGFASHSRSIGELKGFAGQNFNITLLEPYAEIELEDAGRCPTCETPLVLEESTGGLPRVFCPGCQSKKSLAA